MGSHLALFPTLGICRRRRVTLHPVMTYRQLDHYLRPTATYLLPWTLNRGTSQIMHWTLLRLPVSHTCLVWTNRLALLIASSSALLRRP